MVKIREGEDLDSLMKRFKRQCKAEGILDSWKAHSYYVGPSEKRRIKSEKARRRVKKSGR